MTGGLWLAATLILGGLYPSLLQRYAVEPNEIERERPYIDYNIDFTRLAFDLEKIDIRPFDQVSRSLGAGSAAERRGGEKRAPLGLPSLAAHLRTAAGVTAVLPVQRDRHRPL